MDSVKTWFIEVVAKKVSLQVVAALMTYAIAFFGAHADLMEKMGITFYPDFNGTWSGAMPTGQLLVVEFATLREWGAVALVGGVTLLIGLFLHHSTAAVTGAPQSGNVRTEPEQPVIGGSRAEDPK